MWLANIIAIPPTAFNIQTKVALLATEEINKLRETGQRRGEGCVYLQSYFWYYDKDVSHKNIYHYDFGLYPPFFARSKAAWKKNRLKIGSIVWNEIF